MNASMGMMDGGGMNGAMNPMMVNRDPNTAIVAQNPFEDFSPSPYPGQMGPYGQMPPQMRPQMMMQQQRMPQHMLMHPEPAVKLRRSLVANAQNPNTPPVVFCGGCGKEVHESEPVEFLYNTGCI